MLKSTTNIHLRKGLIYSLLPLLFLLSGGFITSKTPTYTKSELLGKINPPLHPGFKQVSSRYSTRSNAYLRTEVYSAFKEMWRAAKKDGIDLTIISATRTHSDQVRIWNAKWQRLEGSGVEKARQIMEYSSMPGISRHHWGTDFDLNSLVNDYFESGEGAEIYQWLQANAHKYGFFQPYQAYSNFRNSGYHEEKWHWSYYPLAQQFTRAYNHLISYDDINGFQGSELAVKLKVINRFVNGIETPENSIE